MDRKQSKNKTKQNNMLLTGISLKIQGHAQTQCERIEKDTPSNGIQEKAGIPYLYQTK